MDNMKALREITEEEYMDLAQNGARILFDIATYRVLDGVKDESMSCFVKDFSSNKWYLISVECCYDLVTAFHCGGYKPYIEECIDNIISSVN